jgi:CHAT domain
VARKARRTALHTQDSHVQRLIDATLGSCYRWIGNPTRSRELLLEASAGFEQQGRTQFAATSLAELLHVVDGGEAEATLVRIKRVLDQLHPSQFASAARRAFVEWLLDKGHVDMAYSEISALGSWTGLTYDLISKAWVDLLMIRVELSQAQPNAAALSQALVSLNPVLRILPETAQHVAQVEAHLLMTQDLNAEALTAIERAAEANLRLRDMAVDPVLSSHLARQEHLIFPLGQQLVVETGQNQTAVRLAQLRRMNWFTRVNRQRTYRPAQQKLFTRIARLRKEITTSQSTQAQLESVDKLQRTYRAHERLLDDSLRSETYPSRKAPLHAIADIDTLRASLSAAYPTGWTLIIFERSDAKSDGWSLIRLTETGLDVRTLTAMRVIRSCLDTCATGGASAPAVVYTPEGDETGRVSPLRRLADWLGTDGWLPDNADPHHRLLIADCEPFARIGIGALPYHTATLAQSCVIEYWPTLAFESRPSDLPNSAAGACLVACKNIDEVPLRHVESEIETCATFWSDPHILLPEDASTRRIRAVLREQPLRLLHIASHASFSEGEPRYSSIPMRDRELYAAEIATYRARVDLVILSGCAGARNWQMGGEERLGLDSAWLAAGASHVASYSWDLHDAQAAVFVSCLHRHFVAHNDAALALHLAIVELQGTVKMVHWAGWRVTRRAVAAIE